MNKIDSSSKLLWMFTISSLLSFLIIILLAGLGIFKIYHMHNIHHAEHVSATVGQIFFENKKDLLFTLDSEGKRTINVTADYFKELDKYMLHYMSPLDIVKIKVFSKDTKIVYSTDYSIIGKTDIHNEKLKMALNGEIVSTLEKKDKVWDLEGEQRYNIALVETYLPIRDDDNEVIGSFEIYIDISRSQEENISVLKSSLLLISIILISTFSLLFVFMKKGANKLLKSDESFKESEERFRSVAETANDAIISVNKHGDIIFWNLKAEIIFGYSTEEVTGKPVTVLIPERFREAHQKGLNRLVETGQSKIIGKTLEMIGIDHNNKEVPIELTFSRWEAKQEIFFTAIIRDISERKNAEEKIQQHISNIEALHSIEKTISSSFNLNVTLDVLLTHVMSQLKIDAACILLLNHKTNILEYIAKKGFRTSALKYTHLKLGESNAGRSAFERRIVNIPDLQKDSNGFTRSKTFPDEEFVSYFSVPLIAKGDVKGILELFHRSALCVEPEWMKLLETIAEQAAVAIDNSSLFENLKRSNVEITLAYDTTIEGWSKALDLRDKETEGHSQRVTDLTVRIAKELGIKDEELVHIRRGALLHDIGKMGIPDSILLKPGKLTFEEWVIMKLHPVYANNLLSSIDYIRPALDIPYYHHEKWDGTGYPRGLKGEDIPLAARIFAIVDVWDALRSDRPYRPAWSEEKTREHIHSLAGTHFDPKVAEVFFKMDL